RGHGHFARGRLSLVAESRGRPKALSRLTCLIAQPVKARIYRRTAMANRGSRQIKLAKSRTLARLWESPFIEIDQVRNALNVVAIGDSHLFFSLFQPRRDRIAPAELRCESVPDKEIAIVQAAALFETPFQNFFVRAALLHALNQIAMMHAQKI